MYFKNKKFLKLLECYKLKLLEVLESKNYPFIKFDNSKVHYIFFSNNRSLNFFVHKFSINLIKLASKIQKIDLFEDTNFSIYFFQDIKEWIEGYTISYVFQEWFLWSKCYGKVLVINGVSSSGKTTLSKALTKYGFHHISVDDVSVDLYYEEIKKLLPSITNAKSLTKTDILDIVFNLSLPDKQYTEEQLEQKRVITQQLALLESELLLSVSSQKRIERMFEEAKQYIYRGENVVIDTVMVKHGVQDFMSFFNFPNKIVLLYTPLEQNLMNCFLRPLHDYRCPTQIIYQFIDIYQPSFSKDLSILISKEKILKIFEYVINNLKERFFFLSDSDLLCLEKETARAIEDATTALKNSNKIYIPKSSIYDAVITIPNKKITDNILTFLMKLAERAYNDDLLESEDILPSFVVLYKHSYLGLLYNNVYCINQIQEMEPYTITSAHTIQVDKIVEQNFFLKNKRGKDFIQAVASNFDAKTLEIMLLLGREQDIAEQIVSEAITQGVEKIVFTILGKEPLVGVLHRNPRFF